jgi:hypothetical protein
VFLKEVSHDSENPAASTHTLSTPKQVEEVQVEFKRLAQEAGDPALEAAVSASNATNGAFRLSSRQ